MTATNANQVEEFPEAAQQYLSALYHARQVRADDTVSKIKVLREAHQLQDASIAGDGDIGSLEEELRVWEFYVLTKAGML